MFLIAGEKMTFGEFFGKVGEVILPILGLLFILKEIFGFGWHLGLGF
jgi:hypothetical protein